MKLISILLCATALAGTVVQSSASGHPVASVSGRFAHRVVSGVPGSVVLYDQSTGDSGAAISSQNFGSDLDAYDDQAADDFVVPAGHAWRIKEVDVIGGYTEGAAESQHITIYGDHNGVPGKIVADWIRRAPFPHIVSAASSCRKPSERGAEPLMNIHHPVSSI